MKVFYIRRGEEIHANRRNNLLLGGKKTTKSLELQRARGRSHGAKQKAFGEIMTKNYGVWEIFNWCDGNWKKSRYSD